MGGASDYLEGKFDGLTITGRQAIAEKWRPDLIKLGNHMLRGKPGDIRAVLENDLMAHIDAEEQGKFLRFAIESAKIDKFLNSNYSDLSKLGKYKTALALEQDA